MAWPTWQEAWVTTVLCVVVYLGLRRLRPSRMTEIVLPVVREFGLLTALYGLWRTARKLPLAQTDGAIERARTIVDFQEAIWLPSEFTVNRWAVDNDWLGWASSAYYVVVHVPSIFAFLIWMFWRHRDRYDRWRNGLVFVTAGCLAIRFWRVAPPRFLPDLGFIDVTVIHDMDVYGPVGTGISGQFVAMPSIHVAWAGVIGFGIIASSTSRWKWLFAAHLPVTVFVVSATGHHWWLDGIVALILLGIGLAIDEGVRRLMRSRLTPVDDAISTDDADSADSADDVDVAGDVEQQPLS